MSRIIPVVAIIATIFLVDTLAMQCLPRESNNAVGEAYEALASDCPHVWTLDRNKKYCCLSLWESSASYGMDCCDGQTFTLNLFTSYLPVLIVLLILLFGPICLVICLCRRFCR